MSCSLLGYAYEPYWLRSAHTFAVELIIHCQLSKMLPLNLLLVTPFSPSILSGNSCFTDSFLGNYADGDATMSVLSVTSQDCMDLWNSDLQAGSSYTSTPEPGRQLVWLEKASVDEKLGSSDLDAFLGSLSTSEYGQEEGQQVIQEPASRRAYGLHYNSENAALVCVEAEKAMAIDTLLPPFWKARPLPASPVAYIPVPESAAAAVRSVLENLKFDPVVASVVGNISISQIQKDIRFLTGEDESSGIISRHSFSSGALTAANWLKEQVEGTGATCRLSPFITGFAPNVIW